MIILVLPSIFVLENFMFEILINIFDLNYFNILVHNDAILTDNGYLDITTKLFTGLKMVTKYNW